ncbi:hypothetical protein [Devosia sp. RR2S18]|uniref:hypothetical protein n=1 Tax=Devosia rhizosphaerae TaxID=3049774 RepID=UPI00254218D7|nr:hypothetical protein [Devosia sp. RR2S18]WIJ24697.1 hypothetical protein QOV41_17010 [Devosia sp. RR2S18]
MVHIHSTSEDDLDIVRRHARRSSHLQHVHTMLLAAGVTAFGLVAVAATMMTTLF